MFSFRNSASPAILFLLLFWICVQVFFYIKSGVKVAVDTRMYMEDAQSLLLGSVPRGRSVWYLGYSSFIAFIFLLGGSLSQVVFLQIAFSGFATICLYLYIRKVSGNSSSAFIATFMYLFWLKIHEWNVFIYTESLFTSFCIISFVLISYSNKVWQYLLLFPLVIFTFLIRPTGIGFVISLVILLLHSFKRRKQVSGKYFIAAALFLLVPSFLLVNKMLESYTLVESYSKAEIIYPNISLGVSMPQSLHIPTEDKLPLFRLVLFIVHNPLYFIKISAVKFLLFFGNIKPYFSFLHNAIIVIILYPIYYFALKGIKLFAGRPEEKTFIFTFIATQALIVTLTTENWDGRFLVPALPFVFMLASSGMSSAFLLRLSSIPITNKKDFLSNALVGTFYRRDLKNAWEFFRKK